MGKNVSEVTYFVWVGRKTLIQLVIESWLLKQVWFQSVYHQGCSGAGTQWNAVLANILDPEQRCGKYRWPQVER